MPLKLLTKTIFLVFAAAWISLSLEFFLFKVTDYNVYRVLDISFWDLSILSLIFSVQYLLFQRIPSDFTTLWNSFKNADPARPAIAIVALIGFGIFSFIPSTLPTWIFFVMLGAFGGFSFLTNRITRSYFPKKLLALLFFSSFNACFIFWMHEEANAGVHLQYAKKLAERRDTIAEDQLQQFIQFAKENPIQQKDRSFWEKKWLNNDYLSSNYRFAMRDRKVNTGVALNYDRPILAFDQSSTPIYQINLPTNQTLAFRLKKNFKPSVYTANRPYKEMKRLKEYQFSVVDHGQIVLSNSHIFDLQIMNLAFPEQGKGEKIEIDGFDAVAYHHADQVYVLIGEPLSEALVWVSNFALFFSLFILVTTILELLKVVLFRKNIKTLWPKLPIEFRIQITLIALTISLFFIIAATTLFFLQQNNLEITYERQYYIAETVRKVILEEPIIATKILQNHSINTLAELADRKQCEIDIYDVNGRLIISSIATAKNSPAVKLVSPEVQTKVRKNAFAIVINSFEKESETCLRSTFSIIQNKELKGFVAINTFESEIGTAQDIPVIMSRILSVYVFLLLVTWAVGLFLINLLTKPLKLLANRLRQFKPGKSNEKLNWEGDDAIGKLIGEYNEMVDVVEETTKELMRAERKGAWQTMAQQIAHEINNPLTPLRLNVQYFTHMLKRQQTPDSDTVKRITDSLIEQVDHLTKVAAQFRLFANMEAPKTEPLLLKTFLPTFMEKYPDREGCQFQFLDTLAENANPTVNMDAEHLEHVLQNLISNAENAIPADRVGKIILRLRQQANQLLLEVEDNGTGIAPELKEKLFDPIFSTQSDRKGLGLPICQRIVEFYGGELSYETKDEVGSCFCVTL